MVNSGISVYYNVNNINHFVYIYIFKKKCFFKLITVVCAIVTKIKKLYVFHGYTVNQKLIISLIISNFISVYNNKHKISKLNAEFVKLDVKC